MSQFVSRGRIKPTHSFLVTKLKLTYVCMLFSEKLVAVSWLQLIHHQGNIEDNNKVISCYWNYHDGTETTTKYLCFVESPKLCLKVWVTKRNPENMLVWSVRYAGILYKQYPQFQNSGVLSGLRNNCCRYEKYLVLQKWTFFPKKNCVLNQLLTEEVIVLSCLTNQSEMRELRISFDKRTK